MIHKVKALVLRAVAVGDQDRLLTLLSQELGIITVSARGVARNANRLSAVAQPFMYAEFVLFEGKSRYSLNSAEVLVSFFNLANEPEVYETAVVMVKYAEDAALEPSAAKEVLELLLHGLHKLLPGGKQQLNPQLVSAVFQLKLLQISGLAPHLTGCVLCGTPAIDRIRFSQRFQGFLCETCEPDDVTAVFVYTGCAKAMLYTLFSPVATLFRFELDVNLVRPFQQTVELYMNTQWDKRHRRRHSVYHVGGKHETSV